MFRQQGSYVLRFIGGNAIESKQQNCHWSAGSDGKDQLFYRVMAGARTSAAPHVITLFTGRSVPRGRLRYAVNKGPTRRHLIRMSAASINGCISQK